MASSSTGSSITASASVSQQILSERTMEGEQAEDDAASRATILVEQTTLTLPDQSRTSNILLSQDQLLYITRLTSHGSDDEECDESAYDVSVGDESGHHVIYINKEAKELPGTGSTTASGGAGEATPSTVSLSRADTGASSASAMQLLSKRSISTASLGDPASSQPGAQHVRGVEYSPSSDEECAEDERRSNSPKVTTATIISQDELEARIRQQVLQEAVVAQVIDPESPEPTKPDIKEPSKQRSRRRCLLMVLVFLTAIASAIATVLAMTISDDDDDRVEQLEEDLNREREEDRRPGGPGFDGSDTAFASTVMSEEDDAVGAADDDVGASEDGESILLQEYLSAKSPNVTVVDSPQHKAFQWMLSNDIYDPTDSFFWEYYALATLFFATNGNTTWRRRDNWLDRNVSPCDWYPGSLCRAEAFARNHGSRHLTEVPQLSIASLDLGSNDLDGTVPEELALLSSLQVLILDDNPLLLGSLISNFSSLSSLQHFSARRVGFMGTFPPNLQTMTHLQSFELQGDSGMNGAAFPTELWSLPSLKLLSLEGVGVTGTIPQTTICPNEVYLNENQLSGPLPVLTSNDWQELEVLDLRNNWLTGTIPSELSNLWDRNLLVLRLEGNDLEGEVQFCDSFQQSIESTGSSHLLSTDCADDFVFCECCTLCCTQGGSCQPNSSTRTRQ